jgi:hypothetical protein
LAGTGAAGIAACAVEKMTSWRERVICQDFNEQCDYERLVKYEFSLRVEERESLPVAKQEKNRRRKRDIG